jgi:putative transposase
MNVYSRRELDWIFQSSIRNIDVFNMISRIDLNHGLKGVTARNKKGSQFIANKVRHYLRNLVANQKLTHIAASKENSYFETFHSIIDIEVIQRLDFEGYYEVKLTFTT